jgi:hypothetical protein
VSSKYVKDHIIFRLLASPPEERERLVLWEGILINEFEVDMDVSIEETRRINQLYLDFL